jgi:hypothetical protein
LLNLLVIFQNLLIIWIFKNFFLKIFTFIKIFILLIKNFIFIKILVLIILVFKIIIFLLFLIFQIFYIILLIKWNLNFFLIETCLIFEIIIFLSSRFINKVFMGIICLIYTFFWNIFRNCIYRWRFRFSFFINLRNDWTVFIFLRIYIWFS